MARISVLFLGLLWLGSVVAALVDGTYDATVTTSSGSYQVQVEVEDGEVTFVDWPNGGRMRLRGADISGGEASGINSRGETVFVEIDDLDDDGEDDDD